MAIVDNLKQLIANREFDKVDDLWTDTITEENLNPEDYFEITDTLKKVGEIKRACLLLEILGDHYETQKNYLRAIEVQKQMLHYRQENILIRKKIIDLYRKQHVNSPHLEEYLELSGLSKSDPIMKAIQRFEEFLKYDVGNYFYFERYGMGKIVEAIPQKKEIVVDFEKKKRHFLRIDVARGILSPVDTNHFLYKKHNDPDTLKSLASTQPTEVVVTLLRSLREPMSASRIKGHLEGIVEKDGLNRFWEKVRKTLEKHDNIRVSGKASKTYTYVESAADKKDQAIEDFHKASIPGKFHLAAEYAKKMPDVFDLLMPYILQLGDQARNTHPGVAMDVLMLLQEHDKSAALQYSINDILLSNEPSDILNDMVSHEHQAALLSILREQHPDTWKDLATKIMLSGSNLRLLDVVADHLEDEAESLQDIYQKIFAMPKQYPKQYLWILKRIDAGPLGEYLKPPLVPRLIDSLEYVPGVKATAKRILALNNFDAIIATAKEHEASRIRDSVNRSVILTDYEKKHLLRVIEHHFPDLFEKESDIIYTTAAALERKKGELDRILSVDIPENKKEIGRAREFGDLSENFEYKAAKEKQDQLYEKVKTIESELQQTQLIEALEIKTERVEIGTAITLRNTTDNSLVVYKILGRWDTDLVNKTISNEAPLARAMIGKKRGDLIAIEGIKYEIAEIDKAL